MKFGGAVAHAIILHLLHSEKLKEIFHSESFINLGSLIPNSMKVESSNNPDDHHTNIFIAHYMYGLRIRIYLELQAKDDDSDEEIIIHKAEAGYYRHPQQRGAKRGKRKKINWVGQELLAVLTNTYGDAVDLIIG